MFSFFLRHSFLSVAIGIISDYAHKRDVLILSFLGSALSYAIIGLSANIALLFLSRIIIGLVKQTYTITSVVITELTASTPELRARELGHISASATLSFLIGPSLGGIMYKMDKRLPIASAIVCFLLNVLISVLFLPRDMNSRVRSTLIEKKEKNEDEKMKIEYEDSKKKKKNAHEKGVSSWEHLTQLARSPAVQNILLVRALLYFIEVGLSSRYIVNYHQRKFNIETASMGFLSSLSSGISLITQFFLIGPLLRVLGGDNLLIIGGCLAGLLCTQIFESATSKISLYIVLSFAPSILLSSLLSNVMKGYFASIIPVEDAGKALAVMSTLSTLSGILGPLYGAEVFLRFQNEEAVKYKGLITAAHYVLPLALILRARFYMQSPCRDSIGESPLELDRNISQTLQKKID